MNSVDWQTVVVTLIAAGALIVLVRPFVPAARRGRAASPGSRGCPSCAAHAACGSHPAPAPRRLDVSGLRASPRPAPPAGSVSSPPIETIDLVRPR